jgi:nucleoside-diphosphate-sugar epimerase
MKLLVTGGTGFTGKALCQRLIADGHDVVALDYKEGLKTEELRKLGVTVVIGSVVDKEIVTRATRGVEFVFHLAAAFRELNVPESFYKDVNVEGTRHVFDAALAEGVRKVVYCSTCGVHGNVANPPGPETAPITPADYYQQTKYEGELVAREYFDKDMETVIVRPAAIYGPGDPERFYMIFRRVAKGSFPMLGNGKTLYHPLYIDNLVDAFILTLPPGKGNHEEYLIADEEYVPISTLVKKAGAAMGKDVKLRHLPMLPAIVAGHVMEKVCRPFGITPPLFPRRVDWYRQNRAFDIGKAKRDLGYQPAVGLDEGLKRTAEWYRREGMLAF